MPKQEIQIGGPYFYVLRSGPNKGSVRPCFITDQAAEAGLVNVSVLTDKSDGISSTGIYQVRDVRFDYLATDPAKARDAAAASLVKEIAAARKEADQAQAAAEAAAAKAKEAADSTASAREQVDRLEVGAKTARDKVAQLEAGADKALLEATAAQAAAQQAARHIEEPESVAQSLGIDADANDTASSEDVSKPKTRSKKDG